MSMQKECVKQVQNGPQQHNEFEVICTIVTFFGTF